MKTRRWGVRVLVTLIAFIALGAGAGACFSAPRYRGPVSDHFDGQKFFTPRGRAQKTTWSSFVRWQLSREPGAWRDFHDEPYGAAPPTRVGPGELRVTFINHATVLLQLDGVNVITDPIYAERASPVSFAGPKRVRPPGIRFEDLPPLDAIVISHNHYDHLNVETLQRLQVASPQAQVFAGLGNRAYLESVGIKNVIEVDWWQSHSIKDIKVTSVPTQHFSNRGTTDGDATLWSGYVFEGASGRTYFAGDTGYGPHFREVGERLGPMRLAVLPIGAYLPVWFMNPIHVTPNEAVQAKTDLKAAYAVAMHFGTFPLGDDGETQPVDELHRALGPDRDDFWVLGFGEGRQVPPLPSAP